MSDKAMHSEFEGHTPAPWHVIYFIDEDHPSDGFFVQAGKKDPKAPYNIEILSEDDGWYPTHQRLADAKLVAAAPDLLKENQSLRSELQKQKELNAELVEEIEYMPTLIGEKLESLIKKSKSV